MALAAMTPRTFWVAADCPLDPAHISRQLPDGMVRTPRTLQLEHDERPCIVARQDIDRAHSGREFDPISPGGIYIQA